jgi:polysaccharide pyruvyl transferase WcaK-like protein
MPRILLVGGDADFNVGDAAILHSLCGALSEADPAVRISVVSALHSTSRPPGVAEVLPKGSRHFATQWLAARRHDLVIVGGGGLLQDDDSRIKMPYWAARLAALRAANARVAGHCLGAGPLRHAESRALARLACATMQSISVRDETARETLQACTDRPVSVVPDPAFMLRPSPAAEARQYLRTLGVPEGRPLIGVVLRRWFHKRGGFVPHRLRASLGLDRNAGTAEMLAVTATLGAAVSRLAATLDAGVLLMPSYLAAHEGDVEACNALASRITGTDVHVAHVASPTLYKALTGELRLLVSARMHPIILAAGMGTPVLGIGYNSKFAGSMKLLGIAQQLLWFDEMSDGAAGERLEQGALTALANPADLAGRAAVLADRCRTATRGLLDLLP